MWNRRLEILDSTFVLDQVNLNIANQWLLPRHLLFRQVYWGEGANRKPSTELYLEAMFGGMISQVLDAKWTARTAAVDHPQYLWTLVELYWYDDAARTGPTIGDIIVFDANGDYVDSRARDRAARFAAKAEAST